MVNELQNDLKNLAFTTSWCEDLKLAMSKLAWMLGFLLVDTTFIIVDFFFLLNLNFNP